MVGRFMLATWLSKFCISVKVFEGGYNNSGDLFEVMTETVPLPHYNIS